MSESQQLRVKVSKDFAGILEEHSITILVSTYLVNKVLMISGKDGQLLQNAIGFKKPMGIATEGDVLAVACLNEVRVYRNTPRLAGNFPSSPNTFDSLFMPRGIFYSGTTDIHDLVMKNHELYAVNTLFSCICKINSSHSFTPIWQPWFVDDLMPEDRCHLNGMDFQNNKPKYVSALGMSNSRDGWRGSLANGGVIMDVTENKLILNGLGMPHSPRIIGDKLYFLQSALGLLSIFDLNKNTIRNINLPGFARGMTFKNGLLFIGMSKIRKESKLFSTLPVKDKSTHSGILILDLESGYTLGELRYENIIDEIYDVQIIDNCQRGHIINPEDKIHDQAIAAPDLYFWRVQRTE